MYAASGHAQVMNVYMHVYVWLYVDCIGMCNVCCNPCVPPYIHRGIKMNLPDAEGRTGILNSISSGELSDCRCVTAWNPESHLAGS